MAQIIEKNNKSPHFTYELAEMLLEEITLLHKKCRRLLAVGSKYSICNRKSQTKKLQVVESIQSHDQSIEISIKH